MISLFERKENIVGQVVNTDYQHFLLSDNAFIILIYQGCNMIKLGIV